ncbi:MAG: phosphotransferase [Ardenticatenales bacterium]|nr:phosphotransferase [Ardenticatenales bacterium]
MKPDPALPCLPAVFDGDALAEAIAGGWAPAVIGDMVVERFTPSRVRYKPGASCVVRGELRYRFGGGREIGEAADGGDADGTTWATVTLYADGRATTVARPGGRLSRLAERAHELHGDRADRFAHLASIGAVLQLAPVDRKVPWLVEAMAPGVMARALGQDPATAGDLAIELVRHVPERKGVLRIVRSPGSGDAAYAKIHSRRDAARLGNLQRALQARNLPVGALLAVDEARHMTVVAAVPGRTLRELRDTDVDIDGSGDRSVWTSAAVAAVGRLHALPATCRVASTLTRCSADDVAGAVRAAGAYIDALLPSSSPIAGRLAERIAAAIAVSPWRARIVHGDWYDRQVLVGDDGVFLIDFDDAAIGEPAFDHGTFVAHYGAWAAAASVATGAAEHGAARRAQATTDAVRDIVRTLVGATDPTAVRLLPLYEAAALLRLAIHPFRRLDPHWPTAVAAIVAAAEARFVEHGRSRLAMPSGSAVPRVAPPPPVPLVPADPTLPTLALAISPSHITAALRNLGQGETHVTTARVVRYKPGRRCLVEYAVTSDRAASDSFAVPAPMPTVLYGKIFASARGARVLAAHAHLHAAQHPDGPQLPEPVGYLDESRIVLLGAVPGVPVTSRLCAGDVALAARIGTALGALHASPAPLERRHDPADELAPLTARVARLLAADERVGRRAQVALARLEAAAPRPRDWRHQPVHRDLHPEQVLVAPDGRIGFVDLDDASLSEPALDVGNFVAHMVWLGCRAPAGTARLRAAALAFKRAHAAMDRRIDPAVRRWCEAAALLRLADVHLAAGGVPLAAALVTACGARLG